MLKTVLTAKGLNPSSVHYGMTEGRVDATSTNGGPERPGAAMEAVEHVEQDNGEDGGIYL